MKAKLTNKLRKHVSLIFILTCGFMFSQTITGVVTDSSVPLVGVNILEEGTSNGTLTDFNGEFTINVSDENAILVFSYLGFKTERVSVKNQTIINLVLTEDTEALGEIVIVGYGAVKKEDQTTSVVSIKSESFNQGSISSPEELIQGKAAGVTIVQTNGEPGAGLNVRIRGGKSITASNTPLYIIDGVPIDNGSSVASGGGFVGSNEASGNPLAFLNPNDIASINVLKDAAAAAIYGSRGANGVILITTKRGKAGEAQLSYDFTSSIGYVRNRYDIYSANELRSLISDGVSIADGGATTDWQDEIYDSAFSQLHNISLSGGGSGNSYRASLSYNKNDGVLKNSNLERMTGRFNVDQSLLNDNLKMTANVTLSKVNRNFAPNEQLGGFQGGLLNGVFNYSPLEPVRNPDGSFYQSGTFYNPVKLLEDVSDKSTEVRGLGNLNTTLKLAKNLKANVNLGFDYNSGERKTFVARDSDPQPTGYVSRSTITRQSKLLESYLTYDKSFEKSNLQVVGGYSYQQFDNEGFGTSATDLTLDTFQVNNFASNSSPLAPTAFRDQSKLVSFFGRAQYNYDGRYILSALIRRDGSTRFGADNKWANFPGISAAWRLINEDFMEEQSTFSDLKLRISYGSIGNQAIEPYQSLATLSNVGQYNYGSSVSQAFFFNNYANPDLKWETTTTTNFGLDWGILKGKLSGTFEYYISNTDDLLLRIPLPAPADPNTILANVGSVRNSGFEASLDFNAIEKEDLSLNFGVVFATLKNEVTSLSGSEYSREFISYGQASGEGAASDNLYRIEVGQPVHSWYGRVFEGFNPDGSEKYADLNGDNVINSDDKTFIGDAQPDINYSFSTNLRYKQWNLGLFFRGVSGIDIFNNTTQTFGLPTRISSRNVVKGELTPETSRSFSTRFLESGSFFRLDNLNLGYTFPSESIKFVKSAKINLSAQNLFVITNYSGQDPEVSATSTSEGIQVQGIDYLTYPRPTTFSLGINLNF